MTIRDSVLEEMGVCDFAGSSKDWIVAQDFLDVGFQYSPSILKSQHAHGRLCLSVAVWEVAFRFMFVYTCERFYIEQNSQIH